METTQNAVNLLKLNFAYNTAGQSNNNGNVLSQTITAPATAQSAAFTATQSYTYDSLNRIKDANETIGSTQQWKQTFIYDRYGNRTFDTAAGKTTTLPPNCATNVCNPSADPTNNKLNGASYDNAGNTKADANGQTFIYDSENKQVEVKNLSNQTLGQYFYDGDGKRVKKVVPSTNETTIFIYDASGKPVAEYSTQVEPQATAKVSYLTNDHLGSPRITTDASGQVISRRDFLPFGEEISRAGYGMDKVRQKFTSYERDDESGLNFAQARMYLSKLGRFSSPDEFIGGPEELHEFDGKIGHNPTFYSDLADPRSLNKYQYCLNNPVNYTDPDGHQTQISDYLWNAWEAIKESGRKLIYPLTDELQEAKNGTPPPERKNTPLGDFADGNGRNLVKRTWKEMADRSEAAYEAMSTFDVTGTSQVLKLVVNKVSGRGNSTSDYVITFGGMILTRGKGTGQAQLVVKEARQLISNWSRGTTFGKNLAKLINHAYDNHGVSVGAKNKLQYLRKAAGFKKSGARRRVLDDGNIHYSREDGTYLITDPRGGFISYGRN